MNWEIQDELENLN